MVGCIIFTFIYAVDPRESKAITYRRTPRRLPDGMHAFTLQVDPSGLKILFHIGHFAFDDVKEDLAINTISPFRKPCRMGEAHC